MKTTQKFGLLIPGLVLAVLTLFTGMQCEKNFPTGTPEIDKLPTATQTGAGTFGCLVDGKAFYPKGSIFAPPNKQAFYQTLDNVQYFVIGISQDLKNSPLKGMHISSTELALEQKSYAFGAYGIPGIINVRYIIYDPYLGDDEYNTDPSLPGEITITKLDPGNSIISGTFWFDAKNKEGKVVHVTEGRFDMHYH